MLGVIPIGGINFTGQSTAQALVTATPAKLTFPNASNLPTTGTRVGDPAVKPDATQSRVQVNAPGIYRVRLGMYGGAGAAMNVIADIRKTVNGTQAAVSGARGQGLFSTTNKFSLAVEALIEVTAADLPTAGGAATFADPDATPGPGKPSGGFAGSAAAPKTGVYLDVAVTPDATDNLTLTDGHLIVERLG